MSTGTGGPEGATLPRQFLYHHSHDPLPVGSDLLPQAVHGGEPVWPALYADPQQAWRARRVWMFARPQEARDWAGSGGYIYRVLPQGPVEVIPATPWDDEDDTGVDMGSPDQFHAERATIMRDVSSLF